MSSPGHEIIPEEKNNGCVQDRVGNVGQAGRSLELIITEKEEGDEKRDGEERNKITGHDQLLVVDCNDQHDDEDADDGDPIGEGHDYSVGGVTSRQWVIAPF